MFFEVPAMFTQYMTSVPGARGFLSQVCAVLIIGLTAKLIIKLVKPRKNAPRTTREHSAEYVSKTHYVTDNHGYRYVTNRHGVFRRLVSQYGVVHYVRCDPEGSNPESSGNDSSSSSDSEISDSESSGSESSDSESSDSGSSSSESSSINEDRVAVRGTVEAFGLDPKNSDTEDIL